MRKMIDVFGETQDIVFAGRVARGQRAVRLLQGLLCLLKGLPENTFVSLADVMSDA
jgi:hypothetical protein